MNLQFKPAWWLNNPHLQTMWSSLIRRKHKLSITNERIELQDGDFIDLGWVGTGTGPRVLLLHGLNGSVNSHYINGMLCAVQKLGWRAVIMHFRGCSGVPNRLARSYHSGETGDLQTVIKILFEREPESPIYALGFSLGGNVLLKALGENALGSKLKAAVAVSVPFELNKTATYLNIGFSKIYQWRLVGELKKFHRKKFAQMYDPLSNYKLNTLKTFWQFDDTITAPLHGFKDAIEYYRIASCRQYLADIKIPTLIVHAKDDPFTPYDSLPTKNEISSSITLHYTQHGGHVGFVAGNLPWRPIYWLEHHIMEYLANIQNSQKIS